MFSVQLYIYIFKYICVVLVLRAGLHRVNIREKERCSVKPVMQTLSQRNQMQIASVFCTSCICILTITVPYQVVLVVQVHTIIRKHIQIRKIK